MEGGSVFALLGPNGAGKSTFMRCVLGLIPKTSGRISLFGKSPSCKSSREAVGFLPEKFSYYPTYTVSQVLKFFSSFKKDSQGEVVSALGVDSLLSKKVKVLSKGELQRVGLVVALMGSPDLIFLDEPFSGLDPIAISDLKKIIKKMKSQGKSVFISSHLLGEMQGIIDSCALLHQGRVLAWGELSKVTSGKPLEDYFYQKVKGQ